jgi:hypothetical protein
MSSPYTFEDPFITTSLNLVTVQNDFPEGSVFQGGRAQLGAAQLRLALTDRLGFYASKDGYLSLQPDLPLLDDEKGFMDLSAGFKYALLDWPDQRFILTPMIRYELTQGSRRSFSGNGEGEWVPAVSAGLGLGALQFLATTGARLPVDGDAESTSGFYHLHMDWAFTPRLHPFVELSGQHFFDGGDGSNPIELKDGTELSLSAVQAALGTGAFEGNDILNLGSQGVKGHDLVTFAVGAQLRVTERWTLGFAYERPLTQRRDLIQQRFTIMLMMEL